MLEMIIEPLRGNVRQAKVSLISEDHKIYDRFPMPTQIANSIKKGNTHPVYSMRIDSAEKEYKKSCQKCAICHGALEAKHTTLAGNLGKVCDECYESLMSN